jgi:hypothetical protein
MPIAPASLPHAPGKRTRRVLGAAVALTHAAAVTAAHGCGTTRAVTRPGVPAHVPLAPLVVR